MAHLDDYLMQFEAAFTARGGVVHWARDADEANRIVTDLVRATGETEVVKVKSMATQEIGLNEALESAGITAYETDLAELIVQLGDDKPSHILVPGDPPQPLGDRGDLPGQMPDVTTRSHRRTGAPRRGRAAAPARDFLSAKVAVTGANFASPTPARSSSSSPRATAGCA